MSYVEEDGIVVYRSKDGARQKVFDALEWLAAMCSHVPDKGEQMVRYYDYYSNVSRGKRNRENQGGLMPCILKAHQRKVSEEVGQADSEDPRGRSPGLPKVQWADADRRLPGNKGSVASWPCLSVL